MSDNLLPGLRTTAVLLLLAALGETVELSISPLDGSSTPKDLVGIAAHQGRFELSVVIGVVSTLLFVPAFLGLAQACLDRSPRLARTAGWTAVVAMCGFMGVRMTQAVELAGIRAGLDRHVFANSLDHIPTNPIGALVAVAFLGGGLVGLVLLGVVGWRAGLPKVACVYLALFQVVDLALPVHPPVSHLLLLVSVGWIASALWRRDTVGAQQAGAGDTADGHVAVR